MTYLSFEKQDIVEMFHLYLIDMWFFSQLNQLIDECTFPLTIRINYLARAEELIPCLISLFICNVPL